jgi:succinate-semialdehyde dehydrogenase / glutarate-semialdehyde dehydrogenase
MHIAEEWTEGSAGKSEDVLNPVTGLPIGKTPHATRADLDRLVFEVHEHARDWECS